MPSNWDIGSVDSNSASVVDASTDPYGKNTTGTTGTTASFRQRGDASQKRVNTDTRVRDDANSGTAGAGGSGVGKAVTMTDALSDNNGQQALVPGQSQIPLNASWKATRQPVDINSVRQRVLQSLTPQQGQ